MKDPFLDTFALFRLLAALLDKLDALKLLLAKRLR